MPDASQPSVPVLEVEDLQVVFPTPRGDVRAVSGISFRIEEGEIFGIVGESGCGKSATGKAILGLLPSPGKVTGGRILFRGEDLVQKSEQEMRQLRGRRIAMIFQDPAAALNPLFTIGQQLMGIPGANGRCNCWPIWDFPILRIFSNVIHTSSRVACSSGPLSPWPWLRSPT